MARYKRRKPFIVRFFRFVLGLALVAGIAFCGLWGYLYFGKNVELVGAIGQVNALSTGVNETEYLGNAITDTDALNAAGKIETAILDENIFILDREFGAILNNKIKQGLVADVGGKEIVLNNLDFEVLEVNFLNAGGALPHLADINIKFKFDSAAVKKSLSSFPFSLIKNSIPNTLYVSLTAEVQTASAAKNGEYSLAGKEICFNTLSGKESANILNLIAMGAGLNAEELPTQIATVFVKELLGTSTHSGIFQNLSSAVPTGFETTYQFTSTGTSAALEICVQPAKYCVEVRQKIGDSLGANIAEIFGTGEDFAHQSDTTLAVVAIENGYTFSGWFTAQGTLLSNETHFFVQNITSDVVYIAQFEFVTKTITYNNLIPGATHANPESYNISYGIFTLLPASCAGFSFQGWWTGENGTGSKITKINAAELKELTLYAHWRESAGTAAINLMVDGSFVGSFEHDLNTTLSSQTATQQSENFLLSGYTVPNWYTNSACTKLFDGAIVNNNITLYGISEYFTDKCLFYPYKEMFDAAVQNNSRMTLNSRKELVAWIDYAIFYHLIYDVKGNYPSFNLAYFNGTPEQHLDEVGNAFNVDFAAQSHFQTINYKVIYGNKFFFLSPETEDISVMASRSADPNHTQTQPQQDAALLISPTTKRSNSFNDFKINQVTKTINNISNSEQLVRVLEQGYRPICKSGSTAETVYNKAKQILREICDDYMTTGQKLQAIYEWLALNVQYDHLAANTILDANETRKYKAWFAEGALIENVAVCEGFAKATIILAKIEGIPAVMVTGSNHAWNKVLVDDTWFEFDATHGNLPLEQPSSEAISYTTFLFSGRTNFVGTEYTNIQTTQNYDFYDNANFTYNTQTFDLKIDSQAELTALFQYVKQTFQSNILSPNFSLEVSSSSSQFTFWLNQAAAQSGLTEITTFSTTNYLNTNTYLILFQKPA